MRLGTGKSPGFCVDENRRIPDMAAPSPSPESQPPASRQADQQVLIRSSGAIIAGDCPWTSIHTDRISLTCTAIAS
jgi:hypothetical protein